MTKKTLKQWEKEIDEGIARGRADIKAGRFVKLDGDFLKNLQSRVIKRIRARKEVSSNVEKAWTIV